MAKNYTVPNDRWIPLSDLMNQDYDHNQNYIQKLLILKNY